MRLIVTLFLSLFFLIDDAHGVSELKNLIKENVQSFEARENTKRPKEITKYQLRPRLWIHVYNEEQKKVAANIVEKLKEIKLAGNSIEMRQIRLVKNSPEISDLRFFKKQDHKNGRQLLTELRKFIPDLKLKDMTTQFEGISWIRPGHFELWLSPEAIPKTQQHTEAEEK